MTRADCDGCTKSDADGTRRLGRNRPVAVPDSARPCPRCWRDPDARWSAILPWDDMGTTVARSRTRHAPRESPVRVGAWAVPVTVRQRGRAQLHAWAAVRSV